MGILSGLGAGLNAASQAAIGTQQGQIQGSALLRAIQMQQYQIAKEQAETGKLKAETQHTLHTDLAPVLGESAYNPAKAAEASAIAGAQVQPAIDRAVGVARGTAPIEEDKAVNIAARTEPIHTRGAIATAAGIAPIEENKAVNIASRTAPIDVKKAGDMAAATMPYKITETREANNVKPLSADESSATMHLPLMAGAVKNMGNLPGPSARAQAASQGGFWRNYLSTPDGQRWMQAARQAALSAAVATEGPRGAQPDRVAAVQRAYVPMPGDDDATAEQKMAQLRQLMQGAKVKAGRGYGRLNAQQQQSIDDAINGGGSSAAANPVHETIDGLIRAGKTDAEIKAAIARGVH